MKLPLVVLLAWCRLATTLARQHEDACGGTYRGFQYTIASPNYPSNYPARTECTYRLEGEATSKCEQQFHLQFLDFNLKDSEGCRADYLQVGAKNLYCGNIVGLRKFTGTNNTLIVTFHSGDRDRTAKGFKILVSALPCSLKLSPLRNSPLELGIPEAGRSSWQVRDVEGGDGGVNNTGDVSKPSIRRDQSGSAAAVSENNSVINGNHYNGDPSPRITSYLFLPPKETNANVTLHYHLGSLSTTISDTSSSTDGTSPSMDLLPPRIDSISTFSRDAPSPLLYAASNVKKIGGLPSSNYAEPGFAYSVPDYDLSPVSLSDCDKSNQPLQQSNDDDDSSERINYDRARSPNLVYDPKYGFIGSGSYPGGGSGYYPGGSYPGYPTGYPGGTGSGYYPGGSYPGGPGSGYPNYPGPDPSIGSGSSECCQRVPPSRRFSIVSPGFPGGFGSNNQQLSCRYTIVKSSPDICRLRLNFRFFNFGADDPYCSLGYLDVDGQRFCGCRTGQSLQLLFTDYLVKTLTIVSAGYPRNRLGGFLIDVTQEPCDTQAPWYPSFPNNPGYIRRRSVNTSSIVPSPLDPSPLARSKRDLGYSYPRPSKVPPFLENKDVELLAKGRETHDRLFAGSCQSRLLLDWAIASKEAFFKNARCTPVYGAPGFGAVRFSRSYTPPADEPQDSSTNCEEINENQGEIRSPFYPNLYSANIKQCYRFNRAPNFCKLELYVRDFDLEPSQGCASDYLLFSVEPKKYCGRSLNDFKTVFDLTQTSSLQVDFATDDGGTGRGFDIGFSRLPCEPTPLL